MKDRKTPKSTKFIMLGCAILVCANLPLFYVKRKVKKIIYGKKGDYQRR